MVPVCFGVIDQFSAGLFSFRLEFFMKNEKHTLFDASCFYNRDHTDGT